MGWIDTVGTDASPRGQRIAVVGAGIAGLGAAWALGRAHDVCLYEADCRLGGHSNTVDVSIGGRTFPVDTGFIVYNELAYPNLSRLFTHLEVPTEASDMSFAVSFDRGGLEYEGSFAGLLAQPANLLRPRYWSMVLDLVRFYRRAPGILRGGDESLSLGEFLDLHGYSDAFTQDHLLPMGAAIWSCSIDRLRAFPAMSFVQFFVNHGLLNLGARPQWRTVSGGSREYVRRLRNDIVGELRPQTRVTAIRRRAGKVLVRDVWGREEMFDRLVLATHADQALAVLGNDASEDERRILGGFGYSHNRAVLHSDPSMMPKRRRAWASWNYLAQSEDGNESIASVTYWMNRLQNIDRNYPIFVSLNPQRHPDPALVHGELGYEHPQFDASALAAQAALPRIQGHRNTWFCGSYCGYGFHEDALRSGLGVAHALGAPAPWVADHAVPLAMAAA